jgi:PKD repeat protein
MLAVTVVAALLAAAAASGATLQADFTWTPNAPDPGQAVTFTPQASKGATKYAWDLDGDGTYETTTTKATPVKHTFADAGAYQVSLRVSGGGGATSTATHEVRVPSGVQASFSYSPAGPQAGEDVTFTSTSTIKSGQITSYAWDLNGDGQYDDGSEPSVTRAFPDAGPHSIGLTVTDNTGAQSFVVDTVQVGDGSAPPPVSDTPPAPGTSGPSWLSPFPTVRIRGRATSGGVHLSLLAIRAPSGATVKVRCKGVRCPARQRVYTVAGARIRARAFERFLPAKTRLELFIWRKGMVGKYTRFDMRRLLAPKRTDMCLFPGGQWPGPCPK